jgi:hypothetical protein
MLEGLLKRWLMLTICTPFSKVISLQSAAVKTNALAVLSAVIN